MFSHRNHATRAYISLGSNLGDRAGNLLLAVRGMMHAALSVTCLSSIYETEPISEFEQPPFLNMVAELGNPLPAPEQVMARLLRIEYALGRTREVKDGPPRVVHPTLKRSAAELLESLNDKSTVKRWSS